MTPLMKLTIRIPLMVIRLVTWTIGMLGILLVLANVVRTKPDHVWDLVRFGSQIGIDGFWKLYWPHVLACLGANIVCGLTLLSVIFGAAFKGMAQDMNDAVKYGDYEVRRKDTGETVATGTTAGAEMAGSLLGRIMVFVVMFSVAFLAVPLIFAVELVTLPFLIHGARKELGHVSDRPKRSKQRAGSGGKPAPAVQPPKAVMCEREPEPPCPQALPGERADLPDDPLTRKLRVLCHPEVQAYAVGQQYFAREDTALNAFFLHKVLAIDPRTLLMQAPDGREVRIDTCQIITDKIPDGHLDAFYYDWNLPGYRPCRANDVDADMNFIVTPSGGEAAIKVAKNAFYYALR